MNQQPLISNPAGTAQTYVRAISGMFFPMPVIVVAYDSCSPIECRASGVIFENGDVVVAYPFRWVDGGEPWEDSNGQIDVSHVLLTDGRSLSFGENGCREVGEPPALGTRVGASISALIDAAAAYP